MIKIPIVQYPNDILRKEVPHVKDIDSSVKEAIWQISKRLPFCQGFGLAANQIGFELPIFGYINLENRHHKFFINPVIFFWCCYVFYLVLFFQVLNHF